MASLEEDTPRRDKLLGSIGASSTTDVFQTMTGSNSTYSTTPVESSPATISTEDLELLNSPTMMNSFEHEMLLCGLGTSSSTMGINGNGLTPLLEHSEKWNLPSEPIFSTWNPSSERAKFQYQLDMVDGASCKSQDGDLEAGKCQKNRCEKMNKQDETPINADGHFKVAASSSLKGRKGSSVTSVSTGVQVFRRSDPANDISKQFDSSDNSDAMEDEEGDKLSPNGKARMSKNLVSERRRRKKLNERLYSLRALVPKISKMDKASIVSDAISYVQELQKQVEEMQADILVLQSNKDASPQGLCDGANIGTTPNHGIVSSKRITEHRILELKVSQMEEQTYHLRIHCRKGPGVLVQLTRALEALDFEIINANLTSVSDHILNTIVVKVRNGELLKPEELRKLTLDVVPKFGLHL